MMVVHLQSDIQRDSAPSNSQERNCRWSSSGRDRKEDRKAMKECSHSRDVVAVQRRLEDRSDRAVLLLGCFQGFNGSLAWEWGFWSCA